MKSKFLILIVLTFLIYSCSKETTQPTDDDTYFSVGKSALVAVVEDDDLSSSNIQQQAFYAYKYETIQIFSELFEVPFDSLVNKDLDEIIDIYGEPWQIDRIKEAGKDHYDKIITLTDGEASAENLIEELKSLSSENYNIDIVFTLHGSESIIQFYNDRHNLSSFISEVKSHNINLRILYQTNCNGAFALEKWVDAGFYACNGTNGINMITMFSPGYFLENWTSGKSYKESVELAFEQEVEKLRSYNDNIPVIDFLLSESNLADSKQIVSGKDVKIKVNDYPYKTEVPF